MSEGQSKQIGEGLKKPVFAWMKSHITGRLMPIVLYDYIKEDELHRIVERHDIPAELVDLKLNQFMAIWPKPASPQ